MPDTHLVFEFDHVSEQIRGLLWAEACHVKKESFNRLPFVGEKIIPLTELLINKGEKSQRNAIEQALAQRVLNFHGQFLFGRHSPLQARKSCPSRLDRSLLAAYFRKHFALRI